MNRNLNLVYLICWQNLPTLPIQVPTHFYLGHRQGVSFWWRHDHTSHVIQVREWYLQGFRWTAPISSWHHSAPTCLLAWSDFDILREDTVTDYIRWEENVFNYGFVNQTFSSSHYFKQFNRKQIINDSITDSHRTGDKPLRETITLVIIHTHIYIYACVCMWAHVCECVFQYHRGLNPWHMILTPSFNHWGRLYQPGLAGLALSLEHRQVITSTLDEGYNYPFMS